MLKISRPTFDKWIKDGFITHLQSKHIRNLKIYIPDYNERLLITMDYENDSHNGVKQVNAIDWLLNK
ncbi:hypothetical protein FACS1894123_01010 [Bacteroidia bacterium]|nr:hypothetical protein FACS1894123_01010 [Bacteroidia bacterium]